eukprot:TRINITY_DN12791_c0_g4_i1.p1 TRINITY_DN12791_c0_g4~~TRINITY_DN12791_c0_g4_i1.p1  ORF type:complete len:256 (+),score=35.16 TRINITY_DN12791_c0_g4_i1:660-1427(+)
MKSTTKRSTQIHSSMELPISILQVETKTYLLYTEEASIISEEIPDSPKPSINNTTLFHKMFNKFPSPPATQLQDPNPPSIHFFEPNKASDEDSYTGRTVKFTSLWQNKPTIVCFEPDKNRKAALTQTYKQREAKRAEREKLEQELYKYSQPMPKKCSVKVANKTLDSVIVSMCEARKKLLDDILSSVEGNNSKEEALEKVIIPYNDKISIELNKLLSLDTPFGERMAETIESMINKSEKTADELISPGTPQKTPN